MHTQTKISVLALGLLALLTLVPGPWTVPDAAAQSVVVADPNCTRNGLDNAIQSAVPGTTITFNCVNPTIVFTSEITINKQITIDGGGTIIFDGGNVTRLFTLNNPANVTLRGLTLQNGNAGTLTGGAIDNVNAILRVENSTLRNNVTTGATSFGGAIYVDGVNGQVTLVNSVVEGNIAFAGGGLSVGTDGTLTLVGTQVRDNIATNNGGGIDNRAGTLNISSGSVLSGNRADVGGGAITSTGAGTASVTITDSQVIGNTAPNTARTGGIFANNDTQLRLTNTQVNGNISAGDFGGIYSLGANVTITGGTISNNVAGGTGGGIAFDTASGAGTTLIVGTTIDGNTATTNGGGVLTQGPTPTTITLSDVTISNNRGRNGGGIFHAAADATLRLTDGSIVTQNQATGTGAEGVGGGIANADTVVVEGSLISQNTAQTGGGFANVADGNVTMTGAEFNGNTAPTGAGAYNDSSGSVSITGTCFIANGVGFQQNTNTSITLTGGWWGSPTGPSGIGPGTGDAIENPGGGTISFIPFQTEKDPGSPCLPVDAAPNNDFYSVPVGESLNVDAASGVLANDIDYVPGSAQVDIGGGDGPDYAAAFAFNGDGSFSYTPVATPARNIDGFRYTILDSRGQRVQGGLVCVSLTDLALQTPPDQVAQVGQPLPLPGIAVQDNRNPTSNNRIQVELRVSNGVLRVDPNLVNQGTVDLSPSAECLQAAISTLPNNNTASSNSAGLSAAGVTAEGNGTSTLKLEGPRQDVNEVLTTLVYEAFRAGRDLLTIGVVDNRGGIVSGSVVIIVGEAEVGGVPIITDNGNNDTAPSPPINNAIFGPAPLVVLSGLPDTVITGESLTGTLAPNIYAQVLVYKRTYLVGTERIGDAFLIERGLYQAAEIFGLSDNGAHFFAFNGPLVICLEGGGTFYYRDAREMPRVTRQLESFVQGPFTCANISAAGLIAIDGSTTAAPAANVPVADDGGTRRPMPDGCMVTTDAIINLREGPGTDAPIIRRIPFDVTLTAFETSGAWFYVDYLGLRGWMSADFVTPNGDC